MKNRILASAAIVIAAIGLSAASAHGHSSPAEHDHFLTVPGNAEVLQGTEVQVGPHICDLPQLHGAFHKFHSNVHVGQPRDAGGLAIRPEFCVTS